jgi:hypothetical protein
LAHRQDPILATILGSKTGEYLAAGLPVITTAAVGAISSLVRNRKLGVCLSSTNLAELNASDVAELRALWNEYDDTQRRCLAAASDFSIERTAARYAALYASLDQPAHKWPQSRRRNFANDPERGFRRCASATRHTAPR